MRSDRVWREYGRPLLLLAECLLHAALTLLSRLWERDRSIWLFGARNGIAFVDNAKYLYLHVAARHPEIRPVWLSKNEDVVRTLREAGYEAYYAYSLRGLYLNLRAGVVLLTHRFNDVNLWCSGGAMVVMLWHGSPLKTIGWDAEIQDAPRLVRAANRYISRQIDCLTVTAEALIEPFASGLRIDPERIVVTGYPRNDVLFEVIPGADIGSDTAVYEEVSRLAETHTIWLYLPTFRPTDTRASEQLDFDELESFLEEADAYLLLKLHPNERLDGHGADYSRILSIPEQSDVYPLLPYTDGLITDYSSIYFDYLLLDKPIVFYAYDLERYRSERGFYFEYESVTPGPVVTDFDELVNQLERTLDHDEFADQRRRMRERFCQPSTTNWSETVYRVISHRL